MLFFPGKMQWPLHLSFLPHLYSIFHKLLKCKPYHCHLFSAAERPCVRVSQSLDSEASPVCVLSRFSHVQLCGALDCSPPVSTVHGILQTEIEEWVAVSSLRVFPIQGSKPYLQCFLHCREDSLALSHQGSLNLVVLDSNPSLAR